MDSAKRLPAEDCRMDREMSKHEKHFIKSTTHAPFMHIAKQFMMLGIVTKSSIPLAKAGGLVYISIYCTCVCVCGCASMHLLLAHFNIILFVKAIL